MVAGVYDSQSLLWRLRRHVAVSDLEISEMLVTMNGIRPSCGTQAINDELICRKCGHEFRGLLRKNFNG